MKHKTLLIALLFVMATSSAAFSATWTNISGELPDFPVVSDVAPVVTEIVSDFRVSTGVVLIAESTVSSYGVAAGHAISGTRIYHSHSNNAQIEIEDMADPKADLTTKTAEIQGLADAALVDAESGS